MSVSEKLLRLAEVKASIRAAIVAKGVSVSEADSFASYAAKIAAISGSGGGEDPGGGDPEEPEYTGNLVVSGHTDGGPWVLLPAGENVWISERGYLNRRYKIAFVAVNNRWELLWNDTGEIWASIGSGSNQPDATMPWEVLWWHGTGYFSVVRETA